MANAEISEVSMMLQNGKLQFTVNIGLCLHDQNLKPLNQLSGMPLIRALSFLHYFLKQSDNFFLIMNCNELDQVDSASQLKSSLSPVFSRLYDNKAVTDQDIDVLKELQQLLPINTQINIVQKFRLEVLIQALGTGLAFESALAKANSACTHQRTLFKEFASEWLNSLDGLKFTSDRLSARFNKDGEFYYSDSNPLIDEQNCPLIASLLN